MTLCGRAPAPPAAPSFRFCSHPQPPRPRRGAARLPSSLSPAPHSAPWSGFAKQGRRTRRVCSCSDLSDGLPRSVRHRLRPTAPADGSSLLGAGGAVPCPVPDCRAWSGRGRRLPWPLGGPPVTHGARVPVPSLLHISTNTGPRICLTRLIGSRPASLPTSPHPPPGPMPPLC